jgi:hypothetical protein
MANATLRYQEFRSMANATLRYQEELEVGKNSPEDRESDWFVMGTSLIPCTIITFYISESLDL